MFKAIVLVCALSVPRAECQQETALQYWESAEPMNLFSCMMQSQVTVARQARTDGYVKVRCVVIGDLDRLG